MGSLCRGRGLCPGRGLCLGGWSLSRGVSVQGVLCLGGGKLCPAGFLSKGVSVWGVSVQKVGLYPEVGVSIQKGGLCPGGPLPGVVSVQKWGSLSGRPPAVRLRAGCKHPTGMHSCYMRISEKGR